MTEPSVGGAAERPAKENDGLRADSPDAADCGGPMVARPEPDDCAAIIEGILIRHTEDRLPVQAAISELLECVRTAASQVGEPREPPAPSERAIAAGAEAGNRFGTALSDSGFYAKIEAIGKAMYAVDFPVRAGAPPTATWINVERLWCKALLPEGPDVIQRVTTRAIELRRALSGGGPPPTSEEGK